MMAQPVPHHTTDRKRVKVYELRNNDWFDRGTGYCTAAFVPIDEGQGKEPHVIVAAEDNPDRVLLETKICKEDGFQKQQETLIVWTEASNGVDMALSFQEAEGCLMIWKFIDNIQQTFQNNVAGADDGLSDDIAMEMPASIQLPAAELGNLIDLENNVRVLSTTAGGREALAKYIMQDDYISKLIPLVEMAEDLESLNDLHRLCNIMKMFLLLNDTSIIEHAVSDECVLGVVGALEYDPDFPSHKANHRQWLSSEGRFKEVVRIQDEAVRRKIHQTYRLQYLKDVVLARILDDPTFSVLNSLIFFNQVDIVSHLQNNIGFLSDLFGIFLDPKEDWLRKKEAVLFIQTCCAIAKNIQTPQRQTLYNNFLAHGLLEVINFGLRNNMDVSVRVGATDILVSMIDHDPQLIRHTIYRQISEKQLPLTDILIDLLLVEVDLGIKSQISDALKVILDPYPPVPPETRAEFIAGQNGQPRPRPQPPIDPQQEMFLNYFYEHSATRLFKPLLDLEKRTELKFTVLTDGIFTYLNDILCFYVRAHHHRSKYFVLQNNIVPRFVQLLGCSEKHLKLVAIRFFRQLVATQDEFYIKHIAEKQVLGPILDVLMQTVRRDNLLSSACLDLFGLISKDYDIKELIKYLNENHRDKLIALSYIETFRSIIDRYDQLQGYGNNMDSYALESEDEGSRRPATMGRSLMEHLVVDPVEEQYWNTSDEEDENQVARDSSNASTNGATPRPLVEYSSDEEGEENGDAVMTSGGPAPRDDSAKENERPDSNANANAAASAAASTSAATATVAPSPPERLSEKRRREADEDEDELDKLVHHKRRNSTSVVANASASPVAAGAGASANTGTGTGTTTGTTSTGTGAGAGSLRRKKSFGGNRDPSPNGQKKIAISINPSIRSAAAKASSSRDEGGP